MTWLIEKFINFVFIRDNVMQAAHRGYNVVVFYEASLSIRKEVVCCHSFRAPLWNVGVNE